MDSLQTPKLSSDDQELVSPDLPPLTACGGLMRRYVVARLPVSGLPTLSISPEMEASVEALHSLPTEVIGAPDTLQADYVGAISPSLAYQLASLAQPEVAICEPETVSHSPEFVRDRITAAGDQAR